MIAIHVGFNLSKSPEKIVQSSEIAENTVCFLVRTYAGHFDMDQIFNIVKFAETMQKLNNPNWVVYFINTDASMLPWTGHPLEKIVINDKRFKIFNFPILASKKYDKWVAGYDVVDDVIGFISLNRYLFPFTWLVITNGDNLYEPAFLDFLPDPKVADGMHTDYWSRYDRGPGDKATDASSTVCHVSKLVHGYIDLGGVVLSFSKFLQAGIKFMDFGAVNGQDGYMFLTLMCYSFKFVHVPQCLFSHSPNPYICSREGGVWLEYPSSLTEQSNACLTANLANTLIQGSYPAPEIVVNSGSIKLLTFSPEVNKQRQNQWVKDQLEFVSAFVKQLRIVRSSFCQKLKDDNFLLDAAEYIQANADLATMTEDAATDHFWAHGCVEMRRTGSSFCALTLQYLNKNKL